MKKFVVMIMVMVVMMTTISAYAEKKQYDHKILNECWDFCYNEKWDIFDSMTSYSEVIDGCLYDIGGSMTLPEGCIGYWNLKKYVEEYLTNVGGKHFSVWTALRGVTDDAWIIEIEVVGWTNWREIIKECDNYDFGEDFYRMDMIGYVLKNK